MRLSVIIPALNEAGTIMATLNSLQSLRTRGHEVIVVDGGSQDNTVALAAPLADKVLQCDFGRARQMNAGARASQFEVLWFLHADTLIEQNSDKVLLRAMSERKKQWGRFDIRLSGRAILLRIVEHTMNWRSRLTGIATGDQGIFVYREIFVRLGGFADIPLMEDIEISQRLKRIAGRPLCLDQKLLTSSRRWETQGMWRTIFLMWRLRLGYALGVDPVDLARYYR
jgi:rSAM/selenodomain-associated transferase 2